MDPDPDELACGEKNEPDPEKIFYRPGWMS